MKKDLCGIILDMKNITALWACFLYITVTFSAAAGGFSEEVHTTIKAGPGYEMNGRIYFLLNYHLYKTPRGIRRFPDGGRVKTVREGLYLIGPGSGADGESFSLQSLINEVQADDIYAFSDAFFSSRDSSFIQSDRYGMNETNRLVKEAGPAEIGMPSPLDYCHKRKSEYIDDIIRLGGDLFYRQEIIRTLITEPSQAREIISRMEKHEQKLKGLEQTEYRIYSEPTIEMLRKKGEFF